MLYNHYRIQNHDKKRAFSQKLNNQIISQEKKLENKKILFLDKEPRKYFLSENEINEEQIAAVAGQAIHNIVNGRDLVTNMFTLYITISASVCQACEAAEAGANLAKLG